MDYSSISIQLALIKRSNMQQVVQFRCNLILVLRELEFVIRLTFFVMTRSSLRAPSRPKNNKKTHSFKFKIFPQQTNILSELQRECCLCDRIGFEQFRYIIYNFSVSTLDRREHELFGLHVELLLVVITFSRERATLFRVPKFSLTYELLSCHVKLLADFVLSTNESTFGSVNAPILRSLSLLQHVCARTLELSDDMRSADFSS